MFTNNQIDLSSIPKLEVVNLKPISKQYLKIIILNELLVYAVMIGVLLMAKWFINKEVIQQGFWYILSIFLVFVLFNFSITLLAFKTRKYALRSHDVIYAQGLIVNSVTTVPLSRIQHVEESRGWLARKLNLSTLNIYTAGESGSDLSIKGLPHSEAKKINDFISAKVNGND
ncbi:MAG: PH domain-containing protein [Algicola sp.]|nr:PH domain-containing protein [Algicola sp.]